jgi:hypothetical protein
MPGLPGISAECAVHAETKTLAALVAKSDSGARAIANPESRFPDVQLHILGLVLRTIRERRRVGQVPYDSRISSSRRPSLFSNFFTALEAATSPWLA